MRTFPTTTAKRALFCITVSKQTRRRFVVGAPGHARKSAEQVGRALEKVEEKPTEMAKKVEDKAAGHAKTRAEENAHIAAAIEGESLAKQCELLVLS